MCSIERVTYVQFIFLFLSGIQLQTTLLQKGDKFHLFNDSFSDVIFNSFLWIQDPLVLISNYHQWVKLRT